MYRQSKLEMWVDQHPPNGIYELSYYITDADRIKGGENKISSDKRDF